MKRTVLYAILGVVVVAVVVGIVVLRLRLARQPEEEARSAVVERGTMLVAVSASGSIEPQARVGLTFQVPGRVAEVLVEVGDEVVEGAPLARLDPTDAQLSVQQAQAALAMAEAQLAQVEAGAGTLELAAAEAAVDMARAGVQSAEGAVSSARANLSRVLSGSLEEEIAVAQRRVEQAKNALWSAQSQRDAICGVMYGTPDCNSAQAVVQQREEDVRIAELQLQQLQRGARTEDVAAAQAQVEQALGQLASAQAQVRQAEAELTRVKEGPSDEDLAIASAKVDQAQASLEQAKVALAEAELYAPFDGVVAAVNVTAGAMAPTGLPAITLLDTSAFHIDVSVDEMDVGRLAEGQEAVVTLDALPDVEIAGAVKRIAPAATFEGGVVYYQVTIELASTDAPVRADMTANATIVVEELTDVLKIPTWVVRIDDDTGQAYVHRKVGETIERVSVTLGVRYAGVAQVLDGLSEGDVVVWVETSDVFGFEHP